MNQSKVYSFQGQPVPPSLRKVLPQTTSAPERGCTCFSPACNSHPYARFPFVPLTLLAQPPRNFIINFLLFYFFLFCFFSFFFPSPFRPCQSTRSPPAAPSSPRSSGQPPALRSRPGPDEESGSRERQPRAAGGLPPEGRAGQGRPRGGREGGRLSVCLSVYRSCGSVPGFVVLAARAAG